MGKMVHKSRVKGSPSVHNVDASLDFKPFGEEIGEEFLP